MKPLIHALIWSIGLIWPVAAFCVACDDESTSQADSQSQADTNGSDGPAINDTVEGDGADDSSRDSDESRRRCARYAELPETRGALPDDINEASGLVVSRQQENLFWLHNDSGDSARLFAVNADGTLIATVSLSGIDAVDWEDMSLGPCSDAASTTAERYGCIYVGDIGDNAQLRPSVAIHRFPEPSPLDGEVTAVESMTVTYPEGARNAEALVVDDAGVIYILTKDLIGSAELFSAPFQAGAEVILTSHRVFTVPDNNILTAADFDLENGRLLMRTYPSIFEALLGVDETLADLGEDWISRPVATEVQGEAVAYSDDGYWHVSEGDNPSLYFVECEVWE